MPEFSNYVESLDAAADATGTVLIPASKEGSPVSLTPAQIAALASGGVSSVNGQTGAVEVNADDVPFTPAGNIVATDVQAAIEELDSEKFSVVQARATRTVTGADASVQTDDNSIIILNSATPFNFTLDQLTASSKISFMNIGAGAVTLIAGSGVTITGSVVIPGAVGTEYPSAFVFYHTATTPRVAIGGTESGRVPVAISAGTLTLDINNEIRRDFDLTATESGNFTIAFSNTTNWKESSLTLRLTGTIAITMPSTVRMENYEVTNARWNTTTRVLTLIGVTASPFIIVFQPQSSIIGCAASDRLV